jgi:hypothetical protein
MRLHIPHPHMTHRQCMIVLWSLFVLLMAVEGLVAFHIVHASDAIEGALVVLGWSREFVGKAMERVVIAALE